MLFKAKVNCKGKSRLSRFLMNPTQQDVDRPGNVSQSSRVASHYNNRKDQGRQIRNESDIIQMKNFNNWIKGVLISNSLRQVRTSEKPIVFDLCCGKFGDVHKWHRERIGYLVGADIAHNSLLDAIGRYNRLPKNKFPVKLIHADCGRVNLTPQLGQGIAFDLVSCQFAIHYCFETEQRAHTIFENATNCLRKGGYFIGTVPGGVELV